MYITIKEKETVGDYLVIILLVIAIYSLIAIKFVKYRGVKMENIMREKEKIREIKEKLKAWIGNSSNKVREIDHFGIYTKEKFNEAAVKLVESQLKKIEGFHGETGEVENISYGLVKLKKSHPIGWPLEIGMMMVFEPCTKTAEGKVRVLGFGINPFSKEIVGISFYDHPTDIVAQQLFGKGGFYFGSTEYPLPEDDMGGNGGFNHFVIPTGNEYHKYFCIAQKIWKQYAAGVYEND